MKIAIYGYYGHGNLGDELILRSLVQNLRKLPSTRSARLAVLPATAEAGRSYDPDIEGLEILEYAGNRLLRRAGVFRGARQIDVLIIGGGGLIQDHEDTGSGPIRTLLKRAIQVRVWGGRVVILGVGAAPLETARGRLQARALTSLADLVTTRDEESAAVLRACGNGGKQKLHVCGDLALAWSPPAPPREGGKLPGSLQSVAVSILGYHRERSEDSEATLAIRRGVASALDWLVAETGARVTFLPFQVPPAGTDRREANEIRRLMRHAAACEIAPTLAVEAAYARIRDCDLLIGMRLHSIVLAYLANRPFIALSYHEKVRNFVGAAGRTDWLVDREELAGSALRGKLARLLQERPRLTGVSGGPLTEAAHRSFEHLNRYLTALDARP